MNKAEKTAKTYLENQGFGVKRIKSMKGLPDFLIDDEFYVEVKNLDYTRGEFLSVNQIIKFSEVDSEIYIVYVKKGKIHSYSKFKSPKVIPNKVFSINFWIPDELHKKLRIDAIKKDMSMKDLIIEKLKLK